MASCAMFKTTALGRQVGRVGKSKEQFARYFAGTSVLLTVSRRGRKVLDSALLLLWEKALAGFHMSLKRVKQPASSTDPQSLIAGHLQNPGIQ
jgi:hypothetical protein